MPSFEGNSWIRRVDYDDETRRMRIIMNGRSYDFCGVPRGVYDEFEAAGSHGTYYNRNIKDRYPC